MQRHGFPARNSLASQVQIPIPTVDTQHSDGQDCDVKVDACTGKVLQVIVGG